MPRPLNRRDFNRWLATSAAALAISRGLPAQAPSATLRLGSTPGTVVPQDFVGLSYEVMQLEDPGFFSPRNSGLVEQFRSLSPGGVLRLGGNTSEFSWWKATPTAVAPVRQGSVNDPGEPAPSTLYAVTPEAIRNLRGFLDAAGWTCIYGLNLGYGTAATAVAEATFVYQALGSRLQYFQVGNEVDLFGRHLRDKATWNVDSYLRNWLEIAGAVQRACPGAAFGLPDVAGDLSWLTQIADRWEGIAAKPRVTTLSHHYYFNGGPLNPAVNIAALLQPDPKVASAAKIAREAAGRMQMRFRMTEGNTCYQGGKPGVSDVFASALWSAEYLLNLMQAGYSGVNLHGGSGHAVAVSVGGSLRGERLLADPEAPHAKPFYTPIANRGTMAGSGTDGKLDGVYLLQPVGLGMKFAGAFAGATMLPLELHAGNNLSAFAARTPAGETLLALIHKDAAAAVSCRVPRCRLLQSLTAPSLDSRTAQLIGVPVAAAGSDRAASPLETLTVPPHTAMLLRLL